ncbi:MAG: universal stress protein [Longimicrobiales bacterium]
MSREQDGTTEDAPRGGGPAGTGRVVLATRFEEEAKATAEVAAGLSDALGLELMVLYVAVELDTAQLVASQGGLDEDVVDEEIIAALEEDARAYAEDWFPGRDFRVVVGQGRVVETIVEHAEAPETELLVVGHHQHGPLARLFGADPAHDLLERAPCPVVVVPLQ